jgi:heme oxygenase
LRVHKEEPTNDLTKHINNEIIGLREELYENYSDTEINAKIKEATRTRKTEATYRDLRRIEEEIRSPLTEPKVETPACISFPAL